MTPEQFCYWLQGRAELMPDTPPSDAEWKMIAEHLTAVFKKVTPALIPGVVRKDGPDFQIQDQRARAMPNPGMKHPWQGYC